MKRNPLVVAVVVVGTFVLSRNLWDGLHFLFVDTLDALSHDTKQLLSYACWLVPVATATAWLSGGRLRTGLRMLGLASNPGRGLALAFVFTLPMLAGYAGLLSVNRDLGWHGLLFGAVLAAFMEELLFRGFLFGMLFHYAGWGFLPAALINGVLFAIGHLYQAGDVAGAISVLLVTFLGGAWFAWLYVEWDTLWVPLGMHLFMNLWWMAFSAGDTAVGGTVANVCRIATIVLSVVVTIRFRKGHGGLRVNGRTWLVHRQTG